MDLFLLPVLLQAISDDETEHGNRFCLTSSLCWVNPEEDGGTQRRKQGCAIPAHPRFPSFVLFIEQGS